MKKQLGAKTMLFPMPAVLVATFDDDGTPNAMTAAWAGICCLAPPCAGVAVRRERLTHANIEARRAFTINVPSTRLAPQVDYVGIVSGHKVRDKLARAGLQSEKGSKVDAPILVGCPVNLECRLLHALPIGSHTWFVGEILEAHADEAILGEGGEIDLAALDPLVYCTSTSTYHGLGEKVGKAFSLGKTMGG